MEEGMTREETKYELDGDSLVKQRYLREDRVRERERGNERYGDIPHLLVLITA